MNTTPSGDLALFDLDPQPATPTAAPTPSAMATSTGLVLDGFAGPGGWSVACQMLGLAEHGIENDPHARATRTAHGHLTPWADMWDGTDPILSAALAARDYEGHVMSPPCQTFSQLGAGTGRKALDTVLDAIRDRRWTSIEALADLGREVGDSRTALVLMPLFYAHAGKPRWLAWEQVPAVLPVWEACAVVLRDWGYKVWTGYAYSEQHGVAQVRKRAVLMAHADRQPTGPTVTHSRFHSRTPDRVDPGTLPCVTMAAALAPAWGIDPLDHAAVADAVTPRVNDQSGTPYDAAWPAKRPAQTIAGRGMAPHPGANANRFNGSTKSRNDGIRITAAEAGALQSFPTDYPWQGNQGDVFTQIGNAVPPLMAKAIIEPLLDA